MVICSDFFRIDKHEDRKEMKEETISCYCLIPLSPPCFHTKYLSFLFESFRFPSELLTKPMNTHLVLGRTHMAFQVVHPSCVIIASNLFFLKNVSFWGLLHTFDEYVRLERVQSLTHMRWVQFERWSVVNQCLSHPTLSLLSLSARSHMVSHITWHNGNESQQRMTRLSLLL